MPLGSSTVPSHARYPACKVNQQVLLRLLPLLLLLRLLHAISQGWATSAKGANRVLLLLLRLLHAISQGWAKSAWTLGVVWCDTVGNVV
jgi:hypothetical protein